MKTKLFLLAFIASISFMRAQIYVDINAQGNNNGTSWTDAYTNLQVALTNVNVNNTQIWVAAGTYSPGSNKTDSFVLNFYGLSIYGGFQGTETTIEERNIAVNPTILSGDVNGDDNHVDFADDSSNTRFENNYHVTTISANNITIDGFKIEDGNAQDKNNGYTQGAAVNITSTALNQTIKNCEINNNVSYAGGAIKMRNTSNSYISITNCIFNHNVSPYASSLYLEPTAYISLTVNLTNNLFINNITKNYNSSTNLGYTGSCGWIRATSLGSVVTSTITNCTFANNSDVGTISGSPERGPLGLSRGQGTHNATISNSIFYGNTGTNGVTTLAISKGSDIAASQVRVYNSIDESGFSNMIPSNLSNTISSNPLFTDVATNDFTLQVNSPAIDSGNNDKIPSSIATDILLSNRIYNTRVDMGAYEFGSSLAMYRMYVNVNVSGGNGDGDSWVNAKSDLQDALQNLGASDEIWVAAGTYSPGSYKSDSFDFNVNGLSVYGGFSGTETNIAERDISENPTILSGDVNNDDTIVDIQTDSSSTRFENNHQVTTISANNITIDGFKIEDGNAVYLIPGTSVSYTQGSAVNIIATAVNPTIQNCEINKNVTYSGGAIKMRNTIDSNLTITNCIFNNNVSTYASSMYIEPTAYVDLTLNLTNTLFIHNITKNFGTAALGYTGSCGWIRATNSNSVITSNITNCTFANNSDVGTISGSPERGPLGLSRNQGTHNATVSNSIFYGNTGTNGVTTFAISRGSDTSANQMKVYNSIDENDFSNIASTNLVNTISLNPLFTDIITNDFTLQTDSPAIDSGDNSKIPTDITKDLLVNNRIYNTTVDMGAYEFDGSISLSNIDLENNTDSVMVYPNPTTSVLNIKTNSSVSKIEIFSLLGEKVLKSSDNTIDVSNFAAGIYMIKVELSSGSNVVKRFIKN